MFVGAVELAQSLAGSAAAFEDRLQHMAEADIVISSTSCPHTLLRCDEALAIARKRGKRPLVLVDVAMPRDIDPSVREVEGITLYDLDDLEKLVRHNAGEREAAALEAQKIVEEETRGFRRKLLAEYVVPTIVALRSRLDEICRQELESFKQECGPFSKDEDALLGDVAGRITRRIAGSLARELKEVPEKTEQEQMTVAVQRLFHLEKAEKALAGTSI